MAHEPTSEAGPAIDAALLDFPNACRYLGGVSEAFVRRAVERGALKRIKVGRRVMFMRTELDRFIAVSERNCSP